jgi:hypothetical protein
MKQKYQRNMLCAIGIVATLSLLLAVAVTLNNSHNQHDAVTIAQADMDRSVHILRMMTERPKPVERHVTAPKPEAPRDLGLLDDIRTTPDAPEQIPFDSTVIFTDVPIGDPDTIQSYSELIGDTGVGIYPSAPQESVAEPEVAPCSVLVAVPPEYPWVAREQRKEGVVGIIVCVDESGRVTLFPEEIIEQFTARQLAVETMSVKVDEQKRKFNYVVTYEEPSGWFFAKKVEEVLPRWVFQPSTLDGQAVKSLIPIGHAFCLTGDCTFEYGTLRNYRQYKVVMR